MKKVKLFEDYVEIQNEIFNLDENQYDNTIEELDSIIENFENAEEYPITFNEWFASLPCHNV